MISKQFSAYLRLCKNGGMPLEEADNYAAIVEHAESLGYFNEAMSLTPLYIIRRANGERRADVVFGIYYEYTDENVVNLVNNGNREFVAKAEKLADANAAVNKHWLAAMKPMVNYQYATVAKEQILAKADEISLEWSEPAKPNADCSYDHSENDLYRIEWKNWKDYPGFVLYRKFSNDDFVETYDSLRDAQDGAINDIKRELAKWLSLVSDT